MAMAARLALALTFCVVISSVATFAAAGKTGQITVYWGQDWNEGRLHEACDSNLYSTIIISFLTYFGGGNYNLNLAGHPWTEVGRDVKYCQSKNILVLLSIRGSNGQYSLFSKNDAKAVADYLWNHYLGGHSYDRPFGNGVVLDGVELDIEIGTSKHYDELVRYLKGYNSKRNNYKQVWVTAALQCSFPDRMMAEALRKGLFDRVHVKFYNNPTCTYQPRNKAAFDQAWNKWTSNLAPQSSVFLGLPAGPNAAWNGYVDPATLKYKVLPIVQRSWNYGGIVLWNRYSDVQTGYSRAVKSAV